jgi:hypothetical protein
MGYKMKVDIPNRPKGAEIMIPGLGAFENGKSYSIEDEQAEAFRRARGKIVDKTDEEGNRVGNKLELSPPLDELHFHGIVIEKVGTPAGTSKPNDVGPTGNVKVQSNGGEDSK